MLRRLLEHLAALTAWLRAGRTDFEAAHRRRLSRAYRNRRRQVASLWLIGGIVAVLNPEPGVLALLVLVVTLASFAILDR